MHIDTVKINIPLKKKFVISQGAAETKTIMLSILNNRYSGEASGSVYYGPDIQTMAKDLKRGIEILTTVGRLDLGTLKAIKDYDLHPATKSALTGMVLNYLSGESKRYPWEVLKLGKPVGIKSSMTISIDRPDEMIQSIKESEYPIVKIKMGNEEDILILDGLDSIKGKDIRVDANGAWSCAKAEEMIFHLSRKGIRVIEQPTAMEFVSEWQHLKGKNNDVELIMDEGLSTVADYEKFVDSIDGVNIKMEKSGGIIEAVNIAVRAQQDKKKVMLGCMVESSVGIAQSVYMSSLADYFDLDGPLLLQQDIARGLKYDRESIEVDREIIGGPKLRRDVLEKYITE